MSSSDEKSSGNKTRRQRYAEDPEFREHTRACNNAWHADNRERVNAERRRKYAEDPQPRLQQNAKGQRKCTLKYYYGISIEDYEAMLARQNGVCAICKTKPPDQPLCVDHDHATKKVRRLLCRGCNSGLGNYKDDPRLTSRASGYLEAFRAANAALYASCHPGQASPAVIAFTRACDTPCPGALEPRPSTPRRSE
jgi:hypothetical protein